MSTLKSLPIELAEYIKHILDDQETNDDLGYSVALSGDKQTALIGIWRKTESGRTDQDAAYIFVREGSTWAQQAKLVPSDPVAGYRFGQTVALSSDDKKALVGAAYRTEAGRSYQGAAYFFTV